MEQGAAQCCTAYMPTTKRRVSINLPDREYGELVSLAENLRVSIAWLGRQAINELLERHRRKPIETPLALSMSQREGTSG